MCMFVCVYMCVWRVYVWVYVCDMSFPYLSLHVTDTECSSTVLDPSSPGEYHIKTTTKPFPTPLCIGVKIHIHCWHRDTWGWGWGVGGVGGVGGGGGGVGGVGGGIKDVCPILSGRSEVQGFDSSLK